MHFQNKFFTWFVGIDAFGLKFDSEIRNCSSGTSSPGLSLQDGNVPGFNESSTETTPGNQGDLPGAPEARSISISS
ncbi:hypothetical protein AVEN_197880-1 [Araneus ventricosus]|uniref:Uncharacterized protein n=1 Tax=Araneus ventricosus TaxID=182803 RepID=A0A4Y2X2X7_ARAVE|nr:hypothetical protein AVEN_197880-1 [Araneus ventricosus]